MHSWKLSFMDISSYQNANFISCTIYDTKIYIYDSPTKLKHQKNIYKNSSPEYNIEGWSTVTGSFKSNYEKKKSFYRKYKNA